MSPFRVTAVASAVVLSLVFGTESRANLLASWDVDLAASSAASDFAEMAVAIRLWRDTSDPGQGIITLFDVMVGPDDIGSTFVLSDADGPLFTEAAGILTDGVDGRWSRDFAMGDWDSGGGGRDADEHELTYPGNPVYDYGGNFFLKDPLTGEWLPYPPPIIHYDLAGYQVEEIRFTIDDFALDFPGADPYGDGNWVDIILNVTVEVHGVPEPSSAAILGACLLGFVRRRTTHTGTCGRLA